MLKTGDKIELTLDALDFEQAQEEAFKQVKMQFLEEVDLTGFNLVLHSLKTEYYYPLDSTVYHWTFIVEVF